MKITLKASRVNAGLTQREMAKKMDRNPTTINHWENGKSTMTTNDFQKWCKIVDLEENQIILSS